MSRTRATRQEAQACADAATDVCRAGHRGSNKYDGHGHEASCTPLAGRPGAGALSAAGNVARGTFFSASALKYATVSLIQANCQLLLRLAQVRISNGLRKVVMLLHRYHQ
jgi:hypothetical protein